MLNISITLTNSHKLGLGISFTLISMMAGFAQQARPAADADKAQIYLSTPGFDTTSMDTTADPCNDFYKFACGKFAANHPIPSDMPIANQFISIDNVNIQSLNNILKKAASGGSGRSANEQKIGDYYKACMNTDTIEAKGLEPIQPLLDEINSITNETQLTVLIGKLHWMGIGGFFRYGEEQDPKDATRQIALASQAGLGLEEKGYYLRTGAKDQAIRDQYVSHVAKMLTLAGSTPQQALKDAKAILEFETTLAKASLSATELRDPENTYHLQPIAMFEASIQGFDFKAFLKAVHSPQISELDNQEPSFFPVMLKTIQDTNLETLKAYMRVKILSEMAGDLPKQFYREKFDFYYRKLQGRAEEPDRWKACSASVDGALSEALGKVYAEQYFAGDSKTKMLQMIHDIEEAMNHDIDQLDWMSAATKLKAKEKLHAITNKIGYPDQWRDYSKLEIRPDDALGNDLRASRFANDRAFAKIGHPVDRTEWGMTTSEVNAQYDTSMNDITFPAGILQPAFYDPKEDDAVNYGHIGMVIGHELTHGFDDEGGKYDSKGNLSDWWTPEDSKNFEKRTDCLVNEYDGFTAVDDLKLNGRLTLGENTADNGGLLLAYMAYLERAKHEKVDLTVKKEGFTAPQRFFIASAQNWCENAQPEFVRSSTLTDGHSPGYFRTNGVIVNQPGFAAAFECKKGSPMAPAKSCRVW